jgi:nitrogenase-associated protein
MEHVVFYEKTGCKTNLKQKAMLLAAGVSIAPRNILQQAWTPYRLKGFFADLPVHSWFNLQASAIKSGEINPKALARLEALELLSQYPILIKRPLFETTQAKWTGFDIERLRRELGVQIAPGIEQDDLMRCSA